jgi:hypothetical protein
MQAKIHRRKLRRRPGIRARPLRKQAAALGTQVIRLLRQGNCAFFVDAYKNLYEVSSARVERALREGKRLPPENLLL